MTGLRVCPTWILPNSKTRNPSPPPSARFLWSLCQPVETRRDQKILDGPPSSDGPKRHPATLTSRNNNTIVASFPDNGRKGVRKGGGWCFRDCNHPLSAPLTPHVPPVASPPFIPHIYRQY